MKGTKYEGYERRGKGNKLYIMYNIKIYIYKLCIWVDVLSEKKVNTMDLKIYLVK